MTARRLALGLAATCCGCALIQDFDEYRAESSAMQTESLKACDEVGYGVACQPEAKSCTEDDGACSADAGNEAACCATIRVKGGMFSRGFDRGGSEEDGETVLGWVSASTARATVPAFALDRFEVTVGRFRRFMEDYETLVQRLPELSSMGAIPSAPASGWLDPFGAQLPTSEIALRKQLLMRGDTRCAWTDTPSDGEDLPINCVNWSIALLFCIWDGGRLPSDTEWNFVAAVGDEQRAYPGSVRGPFDSSLGVVGTNRLAAVGSKPKGATPSGHHDLAGNVWEWVYDACRQVEGESACDAWAYPASCDGCVDLDGPNRLLRGGSFKFSAERARSSARFWAEPSMSFDDIGFRCARDL